LGGTSWKVSQERKTGRKKKEIQIFKGDHKHVLWDRYTREKDRRNATKVQKANTSRQKKRNEIEQT
jgi:hypothetical protein